jgi:RHS repeat-associated protein
MADSELAAVFEGLAADADQAGGDIAGSMARFTESTADTEDGNVARTLAADSKSARGIRAIGRQSDADADDAGDLGGGPVTAIGDEPEFPAAGGERPALSGAGDNPEAAGRDLESLTTAGDPVDVASGDVVLGQVDVNLPGVLPLVLGRTHRSSYRYGRWFGRSWASTLDQRLDVTAEGIYLACADGAVLCYPHLGEDGDRAWPASGVRWPLGKLAGGYTVTDPQAGLVWRFEPRSGYYLSSDGCGELPLVSVADRAGHQITITHDPAGAPVAVTHDGGYLVRVTTAEGRVTGLDLTGAGPRGEDAELVRYGYSEAGDLAEVVNSSGTPLRFSYDADGRLTGWLDRNDWPYRYAYDSQGRCVRGEGPNGILSGTFSYDPHNRLTTHTDSAGAATVYEISAEAQVASVTDPRGNLTRYGHDRHGRLVSRTNPLGRTTTWSYDAVGNLMAVTRPDGSGATASYDEMNLPVLVTEPGGGAWRQEYGVGGNLVRQVGPDGAVTEYSYDEHGHLAAVTDPVGSVTAVECDLVGLPVAVTGPDGGMTRYKRDRFGRVIAVTGPVGQVTSLTWTREGLLTSRVLPGGRAEQFTYDADGKLVAHVGPAGAVTRVEYGCFGRPRARTGPGGARTEFAYDHALRLTSVTHGGLAWRYDYDAAGRLVRETDYNGAVTRYDRDAAGQVTSRVNGAGQQVSYAYDLLGNLAERAADGAVTTFGYDAAGRLTHAAGPDAAIRLERDAAGRVTAETCNGRTIRSAYDPAGRRVLRVTPSGAETRWAFDPAGRPVTLQSGGHSITFGYDQAGRETSRDLPGGVRLSQEWDPAGRLAAQILSVATGQDRVLQRRGFAYRADGCLTEVDDLLAGARKLVLDPAGQVTGVEGPRWGESYIYDPVGNVTNATWPASPGPAVPSPSAVSSESAAASELDAGPGPGSQGRRDYSGTLITRAGDFRYQHDRAGRIVLRQLVRLSRKPDTWRYRWDSDGRLTAVTTPDGTQWRYLYDPLGRRIAKQRLTSTGGVAETTEFTWDGPALAEQAEEAVAHVITWDYRPGSVTPLTQDERRAFRDAPQGQVDQRFYAIVTDLIGTPAEVVSQDGDLVGYRRQTLWGATVWDGASTPLRFPGQYADPETGLHYNNQRYYDPATGRYLSPDPLGLAPGPNPHSYVPNPSVLADPLGLACGPGASDDGGYGDGPTLFRGTSVGFDGGQAALRAGVTPASTDPKVATAFATLAEQRGTGVVHIATPGDLAGLKVDLDAGYLPYEAEAYVHTTPADFAARASMTIPVSTARSILRDMDISVPGQIFAPQDLTSYLRNSPLMSPEQIAEFLRRVAG